MQDLSNNLGKGPKHIDANDAQTLIKYGFCLLAHLSCAVDVMFLMCMHICLLQIWLCEKRTIYLDFICKWYENTQISTSRAEYIWNDYYAFKMYNVLPAIWQPDSQLFMLFCSFFFSASHSVRSVWTLIVWFVK